MNNRFSIQRVGQLLLMDSRVYGKVLLWSSVLAVVASLLMSVAADQGLWHTQYHLIIFTIFGATYYGAYIPNKIQQGLDYPYLTLPASQVEKLVHLLLVGLTLFGLCHLLIEGAFRLNSYVYQLDRTPLSDNPLLTTHTSIIAGLGMLYIDIRFRSWSLWGAVVIGFLFLIFTIVGLSYSYEYVSPMYIHIVVAIVSIALLSLTYKALKRAELKA